MLRVRYEEGEKDFFSSREESRIIVAMVTTYCRSFILYNLKETRRIVAAVSHTTSVSLTALLSVCLGCLARPGHTCTSVML